MHRRPRKIKPLNPEEQHQILQYIATNVKGSPVLEGKTTKKRRRSTGEKSTAKKRANLPSESPPKEGTSSVLVEQPLEHQQITKKMANVQMEEAKTKSPMLEEIMKMEARLTASITTGRDKDISELETRLNENIKSTIDNSIKEALKVMQTSICTSVQNNPIIKSHSTEIKGLQEENLRLNRKVQQLSAE